MKHLVCAALAAATPLVSAQVESAKPHGIGGLRLRVETLAITVVARPRHSRLGLRSVMLYADRSTRVQPHDGQPVSASALIDVGQAMALIDVLELRNFQKATKHYEPATSYPYSTRAGEQADAFAGSKMPGRPGYDIQARVFDGYRVVVYTVRYELRQPGAMLALTQLVDASAGDARQSLSMLAAQLR